MKMRPSPVVLWVALTMLVLGSISIFILMSDARGPIPLNSVRHSSAESRSNEPLGLRPSSEIATSSADAPERERIATAPKETARHGDEMDFEIRVSDAESGAAITGALVSGAEGEEGPAISSRTDASGVLRIAAQCISAGARELAVSADGYFDRSFNLRSDRAAHDVTMSRRCTLSGFIDDQMDARSALGGGFGLFAVVTRDLASEAAVRLHRFFESSAGMNEVMRLRRAALDSGVLTVATATHLLFDEGAARLVSVGILPGRKFRVEDLRSGDCCRLFLINRNSDPITRSYQIVEPQQDAGSIVLSPSCVLRVFLVDLAEAPIAPDSGITVTCVNRRRIDGDGLSVWRESPLNFREEEGKTCAYFPCTPDEEYVVAVKDRIAIGESCIKIPRGKFWVGTQLQIADQGAPIVKRVKVIGDGGRPLPCAYAKLTDAKGQSLGVFPADGEGTISYPVHSANDFVRIVAPTYAAVERPASEISELVTLLPAVRHTVGPLSMATGDPISANGEAWRFDVDGKLLVQPVKIESGSAAIVDPDSSTERIYVVLRGCNPEWVYARGDGKWREGPIELQDSFPCRVRVAGTGVSDQSLVDRDLMKCLVLTRVMPDRADLKTRVNVELDSGRAGSLDLWSAHDAVQVEWLRYGSKENLDIGSITPIWRDRLELSVQFPY